MIDKKVLLNPFSTLNSEEPACFCISWKNNVQSDAFSYFFGDLKTDTLIPKLLNWKLSLFTSGESGSKISYLIYSFFLYMTCDHSQHNIEANLLSLSFF